MIDKIPTYNCKFCNNNATYSPLKSLDENSGVKIFYCYLCKAEYLILSNGKKYSISLYTEINNNTYKWTQTLSGHETLYHVAEPGIPGIKKNEKVVPIQYWKNVNLTPSNINEKLKTMINFS